jgi:hypothetical protein
MGGAFGSGSPAIRTPYSGDTHAHSNGEEIADTRSAPFVNLRKVLAPSLDQLTLWGVHAQLAPLLQGRMAETHGPPNLAQEDTPSGPKLRQMELALIPRLALIIVALILAEVRLTFANRRVKVG